MSSGSNSGFWEVIKRGKEEKKTKMEKYIELVEEILEYFECKKCGNCCKDKDIRLLDGDIKRLPTPPKNTGSFIKNRETLEFVKYIKAPCEYLTKDNTCSVHEVKPTVCRIYPFDLHGELSLCPMGKEIDKLYKTTKVNTFGEFLGYLKSKEYKKQIS